MFTPGESLQRLKMLSFYLCFAILCAILANLNDLKSYSSNSQDGISELGLDHGPVVWIPDGGLKGFYMTSVEGRKFAAFQNIPYAQPPVGGLRFQEPRQNTPWNNLREAIQSSPTCIQADFFQMYKITGVEDCLYLNVYSPKLPDTTRKGQGLPLLPVIVAIHLGGFFFGSANSHGPAYLMEEDVVFVTINYRLGPFGFLSTGDSIVPGNNGLKDQVLALKWVQENIGFFGGDPSQVTLMGESAGAAAVHYHMVSPMSRGLFHRGISQSGCAFCFWSINEKGTDLTYRFAALLKCPNNTTVDLVNCLKSKEAVDLVAVHPLLLEWATFPVAIWAPVIEHDLHGAFLKELPEVTYRKGNAARVPWITGMNSHELAINVVMIMGNANFSKDFNTKWEEHVASVVMELEGTAEDIPQLATKIREWYMGTNDLSFETRHQAIKMLDDRYIVTCGLKAARYHAVFTHSPVYVYQLNYKGSTSMIQLFGLDPKDWGVVHIDDQIYLTNNTAYYKTLSPEHEDYKMVQLMRSLWTNFAKTGDPNNALTETGDSSRFWFPHQTDNLNDGVKILSLNLNPVMMTNPYDERMAFWQSLKLREGDNVTDSASL